MPHYVLKNLLLDSALCSNSLELHVVVVVVAVCFLFSSPKMLWRKVTMVLRPFTRHSFKNSAVCM